jgi:acetoin utilization protein AcuB
MASMTVRDWMTPDPVTVAPDTSMRAAQKLMLEKEIRRLPVVKNDKIIGILSLGDIREAEPSDASSLSIYEINYLISRLDVREIMTRNPITISATAPVSMAARLMLEHKIGGLPVVEKGKLVGIITETDICRLLVEAPESAVTT